MNSEDVIVYLTAIVAVGIIALGALAVIFHTAVLGWIVVMGVFLTVLVLLSRGNFSSKLELIEKLFFVITFIAIVCSFILLYKPM